MKTWKHWALAGIGAIIVVGFIFTACNVEAPEAPLVNSVWLNKDKLTLGVGDWEILAATVSPLNAGNPAVDWTTSAPGVATVSNGVVEAVAIGTATITVTTKDGAKQAVCEVTVVAPVAATGVTLATLGGGNQLTLAVGQNESLDYAVLPEEATNKHVRWSSSDTDVAIASEGVVYAVGEGEATITVTTRDGNKTANLAVTVTPGTRVVGVALDEKALTLVTGSTGLLTATVFPENATNKNVTWVSYNPAVATVNAGTVSGVSPGKSTIVVFTEDGEFEAYCVVTVMFAVPTVEGMVWIKPGTFIMGSLMNEPEREDDETAHLVTLTEGFYMGKYPVSQRQYLDVMGENWSIFPDADWGDEYYVDDWEIFPVENINFHEAIVFCNVLSMNEGLSPAYSIYRADAPNSSVDDPSYFDIDDIEDEPENWSTDPEDWGYIPYDWDVRWDNVRVVPGSSGYRLPTEAQWEYACRAGTITPFNTGNSITGPFVEDYKIVGGQANFYGYYPYDADKGGSYYDATGIYLYQTIPSGLFPPNAWGLYDMHGNLREWCWDWYDGGYYGNSPLSDPTGPADAAWSRITRGGSFWDDGMDLRSAYRSVSWPENYSETVGFRVVRPYMDPNVSRAKAKGVTPSGTVKMMQAGKIVPQRTPKSDMIDRTSIPPAKQQATRRNAVTVE
jgi:uncharacterized protein YjdB